MEIRVDDLGSREIVELLREHVATLSRISPPESCHALDLDGLRKPEVTFWTVWSGADLAGFGALKELSRQHAEVKSMRTARAHLRKGVASRMLEHIIAEARRREYRRLSLETGSMEYFEPARRLYSKFGFTVCGPFAAYVEDPNSVFMTREL